MEQKIHKILQDIYTIAPDLQDREEELKKTIKKLLSSKPRTELDPQFKQELLDKILSKYGKTSEEKKSKRVLFLRPAFVTLVASILIVVAGLTFFLNKKKESTIVMNAKQLDIQKERVSKPDIPETEDPVQKLIVTQAQKPVATKPKQKLSSKQQIVTQTQKPVTTKPKQKPSSKQQVVATAKALKGDLQIRVQTKNGDALPGVLTKIIGADGKPRVSVSNEKGEVSFQSVPVGKYDANVRLEGFKYTELKGLDVAVNQTTSANMGMEMEEISKVITIAGESPLMDYKATTSSGMVVTREMLQSLPIARGSRTFHKMIPGIKNKGIKMHTKFGDTENYDRIYENPFFNTIQSPLSTFSIDVDTASYANVRRFLWNRQKPPLDAVRIEELINYFPYDYPFPRENKAFSITTEISKCPWNPKHQLVLVGLKGKDLEDKKIPPSNLVFLIDVSGSMDHPKKLPLLVDSFKLLTHELQPKDRISIVVYAGSPGLVLPATRGSDKDTIINALNRLRAGGSTAGGEGIILAYDIAEKNFIKRGNNRVILATDGDFNVGPSSDADMVRLIEEKRKKGIFLTVMGFGMGNYKDSKMEKLADKGNGNYFYIDSMMEANKVLVNDLRKTLFTIAKDVKIQIEFNPVRIKSYRLLGYENRLLRKEDFADDTKDAGEIGAGHTVTAFYEIIPYTSGQRYKKSQLKYQQTQINSFAFRTKEIMEVRVRYKKPTGKKSILITRSIKHKIKDLEDTSDNFRFASSVAEFGLMLRNSKYKDRASFESLLHRAKGSLGRDKYGYRKEFIKLVKIASDMEQSSTKDK